MAAADVVAVALCTGAVAELPDSPDHWGGLFAGGALEKSEFDTRDRIFSNYRLPAMQSSLACISDPQCVTVSPLYNRTITQYPC